MYTIDSGCDDDDDGRSTLCLIEGRAKPFAQRSRRTCTSSQVSNLVHLRSTYTTPTRNHNTPSSTQTQVLDTIHIPTGGGVSTIPSLFIIRLSLAMLPLSTQLLVADDRRTPRAHPEHPRLNSLSAFPTGHFPSSTCPHPFPPFAPDSFEVPEDKDHRRVLIIDVPVTRHDHAATTLSSNFHTKNLEGCRQDRHGKRPR